MPTFPFEVALEEILRDPENYVDSVFSCLESEFLVMPKGAGFVEYPVFERGFGVRREDMKKMILATRGKVFTAKTLDRLVEYTQLREYKANQ